jgi:hypothetical protein
LTSNAECFKLFNFDSAFMACHLHEEFNFRPI